MKANEGKENKMKGNKMSGSFTIELALLMPFLLGVFLFLLFMTYYLHDCCIIEKACQTAVLRGSQETKQEQIEEIMEEAFDEVVPGRLLGNFLIDGSVVITKEIVMIEKRGVMEMREGFLAKLLHEKIFAFATECSAERIEEPIFIRKQKRQGIGYCSGKAMKEK